MLGEIAPSSFMPCRSLLIKVLFLTNFKLGQWLPRLVFDQKPLPAVKSSNPEEAALERKAHELEEKARLEEEVAKTSALRPVTAKPSHRTRFGAGLRVGPRTKCAGWSYPKAKPAKDEADEPHRRASIAKKSRGC